MSLLRMALAAARKTPESRGMNAAAASQSEAVRQRGIMDIFNQWSEASAGASASAGRVSPVPDAIRPLNLLAAIDPKRLARREAGSPTAEDQALWDDIPYFLKIDAVGPGLSNEERVRGSVNALLFRDSGAEGAGGSLRPLANEELLKGMGHKGPVAYNERVEGGVGSIGGGLGGNLQGFGKYLSFADLYRKSYDALMEFFAVERSGKKISTMFSTRKLVPETTGHWDAYMVDQPEFVKRQMYGIVKALDQFKDWQPNRIYAKEYYGATKPGFAKARGLPHRQVEQGFALKRKVRSSKSRDETLTEAQLRNFKKYDLGSGEQVLSFEGLSKNGEDYISVDLIIPDFRVKWNSELGGWDIGEYYGKDFTDKWTEWSKIPNRLTVQKWGFNERNTLNNPATRSEWAAEISDERDWVDDVIAVDDRLKEPDPFGEYTEIPLNYDVDMTDLFYKRPPRYDNMGIIRPMKGMETPPFEKNLNDMKTMYYSDVYRILQDTFEKTLKADDPWELAAKDKPDFVGFGGTNPRYQRSAAGIKLEKDVLAEGTPSQFDDVIRDVDAREKMAIRIAGKETTAIFKRLGIPNHQYLSESFFMDTERANTNFLFEPSNYKHGGGRAVADWLYNIASDRLRNISPEVREVMSDPNALDAYKMSVVYDDKIIDQLESAAINFDFEDLSEEETAYWMAKSDIDFSQP